LRKEKPPPVLLEIVSPQDTVNPAEKNTEEAANLACLTTRPAIEEVYYVLFRKLNA
jgi:hypothetical protein